MRILVNASVCTVGGGVQVATSFIWRALRDPRGHQWHFAVSSRVLENLAEEGRRNAGSLDEIVLSPSWLRRGSASRKRLREITAAYEPDVVFTVFGPAYVDFAVPHVCGFADGWVTHATPLAYRAVPTFQRWRVWATKHWKRRWLSPNDFYCTESEVSRQALARIVGIPDDRVAVIPNAYSEVFSGAAAVPPGVPPDGVIRVLTIANPYPHKNLPIIPSIAKALEALAPEREFRFIVTLPEGGEEVMRFWRAVDRLGVRDMIENVGRLRLDECPAWYSKASIVLLPTLLETFSATYPEAMKMGRPIVTPDLDFAHDICADAAIFYPPLSARKAAEAIRQLVADPDLYRTMVERGYEQLKRFPSPEQKYEMQLAWLEQVARAGGDTGVIGRPRR